MKKDSIAHAMFIFHECSMREIESIRDEMEKRHGTKLPEIDIIYSNNATNAFTIPPVHFPTGYSQEQKEVNYEKRDCELKKRGLRDNEIKLIDTSKYTIFLPKKKFENYRIKLSGSKWEELGHVLAYTLGVRDDMRNESIALAYRFIGLLQGVKQGLFDKEQAIEEIESTIKNIGYEKQMAGLYSKLRTMGLKVPRNLTVAPHDSALFAIRKFNPSLEFRNRDLDDLLAELEKSIEYALRKTGMKKRITESIKTSLRRQHHH